MDLKQIRIERLKQYAKTHGLTGEDGEVDNPAGLGKLIGKQPNQVYNLLSGMASFGEKVARSIEESAGLPTRWLDTDSGLAPDVAILALKLDRLPEPFRGKALEILQDALDIITISMPPSTADDMQQLRN